jgi:lanthanide-dependent methanol dehydrogenase
MRTIALILVLFSACRDRTEAKTPTKPRESTWAALPAEAVPQGHVTRGASLAERQNDVTQWVMSSRTWDGHRFVPLDEINRDTVTRLTVAWTHSMGSLSGQEAAPLVVDGTMYVVDAFPNDLLAIDLTREGAPLKWRFEPHPDPSSQGVACCDVVNRGAAWAEGKIIYNLLDDHTVAVDAATGKELWRTKLGDINKGESMTMAPLVVGEQVLVGNSGGELGVRGWLTALDVHDGSILWRAYSTGPDADVRIGGSFKPFYAMDRGTDLGVSTWPPGHWKVGGGTVWGWITYDPKNDLIFYGTGNPGPWNPELRPGDNKWTAGLFARRPRTGEAVWFYQVSPHDLFDHDNVNESLVAELTIDGRARSVLIHPGRTGYVYVLDRLTGEVLSADPFVHITSSEGVDLDSGRLKPKPGMEVGFDKVVRGICPASPGGKDWPPSSYDARTGTLFIPANNLCQDEEGIEANYIAGTPYVGANTKMYAGPGGNRGELIAWDVAARKKKWSIPEHFPMWSGTLVTSGGLVFYGTMDGWFKAADVESGQVVWKFKTSSGIIGQPISFKGPDGKQYVSVLSGVGGWAGAIVSAELDARDPTAALGFVNAMADLPKHTTRGGVLYTFALGGPP